MPKLYTFYERILAVNMEKMRLDKYLSKVLGVSRSQVAHLVDKKMVLVNGVVAEKNGIFVEESDEIKIAESRADSADLQNLIKNNPRVSANLETRPLRGAKNRIQGRSSASADFLLEADKRGSPPKSEKAAAFWRVGGAGRGVQPFLREKTSKIDSEGDAESINESQGGLPRSHSLTRNDENSVRVAESALDSANSQNLALKIQRIYEDDDILVLNKPPFLATHGAPSLKEPSLVEWLKAHKIQRSTISGELREGIVHRLDKQTSGALVVAKNNAAHQALSAQLADKTMTRLYLAIIDLPLKEDIEIECFLARNPKNRLKISKVDVRKYKKTAESSLDSANSQNLRGKPPCDSAILSQSGLPRSHSLARNDEFATDSQNLPKFARYSKSKFYKLLPSKDGKKELILARLFTGRTHQIRAHLESINRHIVGDELYGYKRGKGKNYRVMLHAYLLELRHPKHIIFAESDNSVLGMQFRTCGNFRTSTDSSLVDSPKISTNTKATPQSEGFASEAKQPSLPLRFCESQNLWENSEKIAESSTESQSGLPRRFCESARNDNFLDSSVVSLPQNDNLGLDSAISKQDANSNLRFIAPLFDDMQDYLAKNFDMEKVDEILRTLPARAF